MNNTIEPTKLPKKTKYAMKVTPNFMLPLIIVVVALLTTIIQPRFFTLFNFQNLLIQASFLAILAFGQTFVMLTRNFDLSVAANAAIVGVVTAMTINQYGMAIGILAGLLLGVVIGLINGLLVAYSMVPSLIVTLGMMTILRGLGLLITNGEPVTGLPPAFREIVVSFIGPIPQVVLIVCVLLAVSYYVLTQTVFGRHIYAKGGNEEAAKLTGINVRKIDISVFVISGLAAAIGGILLASRVNSGQPTIAEGLELEAIAAVAIGAVSLSGGAGSIINVAFGVLLLALLNNVMNLIGISSYVQDIALGVVLVLAVSLDQIRRRKKRHQT
ncbi:ABC transporter permease [Paenibacillus naphthalenovorans]|uniref:ABC transporter permease n=1 Tax=Paenibacillus naphthalenovorans TaxID=162209 RepID=UPI000880BAF5|nr:ABC transporter permease [Paenibacillus naphthalenovorans]SDI92807.1 putative xylitol transport system permease protein [Paenibacillus naphthalenovorans]